MDKIKLYPTAALVMLWALKLYNKGSEGSEKLAILPSEIVFDEHFKSKINYDASQQLLTFKGVMSEKERDGLLRLSQDVSYKKTIDVLFRRSQAILNFINQLDLSSGKDLYDKCNAICPWYEEVILNRKYFLKYLIEKHLSASRSECQLVFLAAGKSPLSLELLMKNFSKIYRILEIDLSGMDQKKGLYYRVSPELAEKVKCITGDITSPDIAGVLTENDCHRNNSTIILMEGISYYLSKKEMKTIITSFSRKGNNNILIIEHLVPYQYVNQERRAIPQEIFRTIREYTELNDITCYTKIDLERFFWEKDGNLTANYSMKDMEFLRTSANIYFKKQSDGWIECSVGKI